MTAFVEAVDRHDPGLSRGGYATVEVAGVHWPRYKLQAVVSALVVGLVALAVTGSGQVTMWVSALVLVGVWWVQRVADRRRHAAGRMRPLRAG